VLTFDVANSAAADVSVSGLRIAISAATSITVLARGSVLAEGPYAQVSKDPLVLEAYVGTTEEAA
jgi:branched-chain amino acid transport system ATP-binding protein